ncbi:MAG: hypothetical protein LYZ70_02675 [Nitrososphaerales archaeon]|nr:hypothetical protein [Nitrososphaerales archaeon]
MSIRSAAGKTRILVSLSIFSAIVALTAGFYLAGGSVVIGSAGVATQSAGQNPAQIPTGSTTLSNTLFGRSTGVANSACVPVGSAEYDCGTPTFASAKTATAASEYS